jgi:predicted amidohydrolase
MCVKHCRKEVFMIPKRIKVAAVQMAAELAEPEKNYIHASQLIKDAFTRGAELVLLPEMFNTAVAYHPKMLESIAASGDKPLKFLSELSREYNGVIGGSFLQYDGNDVYNTFYLVFPDGEKYTHRKDLPTMWENCYYTGGDDDGVINTPIGNIGIVLCWEMIRAQTIKRLMDKVDFILAASCWWGTPVDQEQRPLDLKNMNNLRQAPITLSEMLGVPVIHASHAGTFDGYRPPEEKELKRRQYLGETKIVDESGRTKCRLRAEEGAGILVSEIELQKATTYVDCEKLSFWIPEIPEEIMKVWEEQGEYGKRYYQETTKPYLKGWPEDNK